MSVDPVTAPVKRRRPYDGSRRQEQARRARSALLDAALTRFLDQGYTATTVESIATAAGVSAATIYKTYGGKPGLVRALCEQALGGAGPVPAEQRSDALKQSEPDPRALIEGWGLLTAEVAPRVAPILLLLRDAADGDPVAAALHEEVDHNRLTRMAHNASHLAKGGRLRPGVTQKDARDVLWLFSSPELFDLLVRRRGWSVRKYSRFVTDAMVAALL
jgi:AcrR family transcriptional regulator